jgi:hypothetical protein
MARQREMFDLVFAAVSCVCGYPRSGGDQYMYIYHSTRGGEGAAAVGIGGNKRVSRHAADAKYPFIALCHGRCLMDGWDGVASGDEPVSLRG